jgi:hypothetical protein
MPKPNTSVIDSCRKELGSYYLALNPGYSYVPYQQERIIPAIEALAAGDLDRLMLFVPAGHAKSDIATKAFIPWYLGNHPNHNAMLVCHTYPLAKDFGSHIRNTMSRNPIHLAAFPQCRVDNANRASDFFKTSAGNSFYAFGMDGGATGRRADILIIEDPIKDLQEALSETVQHAIHNTYKAVLKDRLRPGGKILFIMTRWAVRDLAARILEEEGARWKVLVLKAQEPDPLCEGCRDNVDPHKCTAPYLWEGHFGRDRYEEAKEDGYIWESKWQQMPKPFLAQPFQQEWLRFYLPQGARPEVNADGTIIAEPADYAKIIKFNTYIFVDPALGKESRHDRTCILVLAAGPERRLFLVDAVLDRLDPGERINHLVRLVRLWKPQQVVYEEYGLTADSYFIDERFKQEGIELAVTSVGRKAIRGMSGQAGGRLSKADRIMQLASDFKNARIWLPKKMTRKLSDGSNFEIIKYVIEREILPWAGEGSTVHDEFLDCLSRIHDPEVWISHVEREEEDVDHDSYTPRGSWEANL